MPEQIILRYYIGNLDEFEEMISQEQPAEDITDGITEDEIVS